MCECICQFIANVFQKIRLNFLASAAMVSMVHDFVQMGINQYTRFTLQQILIQSQHQRLNNFLCFQKQNISGVFYQYNYVNKPTRLYSREVLHFKVLYRNDSYFIYRCVYLSGALSYIAEYKIVFKVFELKF